MIFADWPGVAIIIKSMPYLLEGALYTIATVVCALAIGFLFGVPMAVLQVYGPQVGKRIVTVYIWFFRGVPILILLYAIYFGLAYQLSIPISPFWAASLVLGLTSTAYQSQIFRGSFLSLSQGQLRAAQALGMSTPMAIWSILLPQALRLSIPGWSNEYSILLKDSVLVSAVGIAELMARTKHVASTSHEYLLFYCLAAILYFLITCAGVRLLKRAEKFFSIPGYTAA